MARILITRENGENIAANGHVTFEIKKVIGESNEEYFIVDGQLAIHDYIYDISRIETDRYILENVEVVKETFGTNDYNILYSFILEDAIDIKVKPEYLTNEERIKIEKEEYEDDEKEKTFNPNFLGGEDIWSLRMN